MAIGSSEGCWQSFQLHNQGGAPAAWRVPSSVTEKAKQQNGGGALLSLSPNCGVLPPRSAVDIQVYVTPAKPEKYIIPINVIYRKAETDDDTEGPGGENDADEAEKTLSFCLTTRGCTDSSQEADNPRQTREAEEEEDISIPLSAQDSAVVPVAVDAKLTRERIAFRPTPFR